MPAPGSPMLGEPRRHGRERERLGLDVGHLVPAQRHRDARVGQRPDRVGRRDRPVLGVLVVVEEDAVALLLPPLARWRSSGARRSTSRASASAARRTSGYVQRGSMRTLMWMPREPEVFGQPTSPTASSASCATSATSRICDHVDARHRVEVDAQLVGMVEVVGADRVRVEVDAAEVDDPGEPAASSSTISSAVRPDGKRQRRRSEPVGPVLRRALLEERLAAAPLTKRFRAIGRPPAPRSAPSATAR